MTTETILTIVVFVFLIVVVLADMVLNIMNKKGKIPAAKFGPAPKCIILAIILIFCLMYVLSDPLNIHLQTVSLVFIALLAVVYLVMVVLRDKQK